jgi:uncharacterized protein YndB with AHSA1/START domain
VTETEVLEVSVHISARPETVFPYFTDAERYVQWMGSTAVLEPVAGGVYRVGMRNGVEAVGTFVEVDFPRRVVLEVTLVAEDGGTRVVLRHFGLPTAALREHHRSGWEAYLGRLALRAAGQDPGSDPNA